MDKDGVVHLYKGILINLKRKPIWVTWAEVDEPAACNAEWSKSERENQILYIYVYMESRKMALINLVKGRKRDTENRFVDTMGEGEGKLNWESSVDT